MKNYIKTKDSNWKFIGPTNSHVKIIDKFLFNNNIKIKYLNRFSFEEALEFANDEWRLPKYEEIENLFQISHTYNKSGIKFSNNLYLPFNSSSDIDNDKDIFILNQEERVKCDQCIFWCSDLSYYDSYDSRVENELNIKVCEIVRLHRNGSIQSKHTCIGNGRDAGVLLIRNCFGNNNSPL